MVCHKSNVTKALLLKTVKSVLYLGYVLLRDLVMLRFDLYSRSIVPFLT